MFPASSNRKSAAIFQTMAPGLCNFGIKLLADDNPKEVNQESLNGFMAHMPAGSSFKTIKHYKQLMKAKQFEYFNYGKMVNLEKYGQDSPPLIPLENITDFPIAIFAGVEDKLAAIDDVRWLKDVLTSQNSVIFYEEYMIGHLTFLIPNNLKHFKDICSLL